MATLDPSTITATIPADAEYTEIGRVWRPAAQAVGITVDWATHCWDCFTDRQVPEVAGLPTVAGTHYAAEDLIGEVVGITGRYYFLINDHGTARALLVPTLNPCRHCGLETDLGPEDERTEYVCCDDCGHAHCVTVIEALAARGLRPHQPFHLDTVWVTLTDGSILQIGDHHHNLGAGNLALVGAGGYTVWRDLHGVGVGGPEGDGTILDRPEATLEEMIDAVVAEAHRAPTGQATGPTDSPETEYQESTHTMDKLSFPDMINCEFQRARRAVTTERDQIQATRDLLYSADWQLWTATVHAAAYTLYELARTVTEERGPAAGITALSQQIGTYLSTAGRSTDPFANAAAAAKREAASQVLATMREHVDYAEITARIR